MSSQHQGLSSSQISERLLVPQTPAAWQALHRAHVTELSRRYDDMFRRLSDVEGVVIHTGRQALKYNRDDQYFPVAWTPHFVHWLPYQETPALLVIKPAMKPTLYLETHNSFWEGPGPRSTLWDQSSFEVVTVRSLAEVALPRSAVWVGDDLNLAEAVGILPSRRNMVDALAAMDQLRTTKTPFEVACVRQAAVIAAKGHNHLRDLFLAGDYSEFSMHLEYLRVTEQTEFGLPYGNIVALGANASILHHVHYDRLPRSGETTLLVDAGASCNGYASDITRTWVRGTGPGASLMRTLVEGVDVAQQKLCAQSIVGTSYEDLHNRAHYLLAELCLELKIINGSIESTVESGATRCLFPHGLGHSLGIQVHDVGMKLRPAAKENPYLRNTSVIKAGQIVTVEPGIYFIPELLKQLKNTVVAPEVDWTKIESLIPFGGVRIEDDVLMADEGPVNLTRDLIH